MNEKTEWGQIKWNLCGCASKCIKVGFKVQMIEWMLCRIKMFYFNFFEIKTWKYMHKEDVNKVKVNDQFHYLRSVIKAKFCRRWKARKMSIIHGPLASLQPHRKSKALKGGQVFWSSRYIRCFLIISKYKLVGSLWLTCVLFLTTARSS